MIEEESDVINVDYTKCNTDLSALKINCTEQQAKRCTDDYQ